MKGFLVGYGIFLVLDPGRQERQVRAPLPSLPTTIPPLAWGRPLTSRPQVPQGHVDGEVAKLADLSEQQGQPRAPQSPHPIPLLPACLPRRWRVPV